MGVCIDICTVNASDSRVICLFVSREHISPPLSRSAVSAYVPALTAAIQLSLSQLGTGVSNHLASVKRKELWEVASHKIDLLGIWVKSLNERDYTVSLSCYRWFSLHLLNNLIKVLEDMLIWLTYSDHIKNIWIKENHKSKWLS